MVRLYKCKDELSTMSDKELFHIYCGYPIHRPKEERYLAARILESRDFKFKKIAIYKQKWELETWNNLNKKPSFSLRSSSFYNKLIIFLLFMAFLLITIFVINPVFFSNGNFSFSSNGDVWYFLNIFSFVAFIYIFGFIGYIGKFISKFRTKKKAFNMYDQQAV
ncbi:MULTISPECIES: hypothetical protein [unclassified Lentimicrobium]|uniref:hypothetical protein n=1 Tax=unclassified Lentimicrobium TaxID=2677434 RepID=UPI001557AC3E|nr:MULTISPECIES: hypothetical protein [unclassified Lentimicrobium]NPD44690.1 hypothetical protein [Lentimicrobium sp. S6]NPD83454.1 hypothetical protein [Lentimicrobium sp. L6]